MDWDSGLDVDVGLFVVVVVIGVVDWRIRFGVWDRRYVERTVLRFVCVLDDGSNFDEADAGVVLLVFVDHLSRVERRVGRV